MSGQLVGEVLDAAEAGQLDGLSRPAFAALLAIAERCHHISRQGTVRNGRIRAAIHEGNSVRTARRAIRELKDASLIRVVTRGYKAPNGEAKSSMYELLELVPPKAAEASNELVPPKLAQATDQACAKSGEACAKSERACAAQGGTIDGSLDGSLDGGACASDEPNVPASPERPQEISDEQPQPPDPEPDRYCADHMPDGTDEKCGPCKSRRLQWQQWNARRDAAIRNCGLCDDRGGVGLRAGPFIKCPHDKKRIDELEQYHRAREIESA